MITEKNAKIISSKVPGDKSRALLREEKTLLQGV